MTRAAFTSSPWRSLPLPPAAPGRRAPRSGFASTSSPSPCRRMKSPSQSRWGRLSSPGLWRPGRHRCRNWWEPDRASGCFLRWGVSPRR